MLAVHPEVESQSEMWFLLPFVYTLRETGVFAEYSARSLHNAMTFLIDNLPHKKQDYFESLRLFAESLYERMNHSRAKYFLDKTPRYYLIIDEIANIFPDAKFLFLFRNPLGTLASVVQSFNNGKLGDFRHRIDLYKGPFLLADGYKRLEDNSLSLQYEQLLANPTATLECVCDYLGIEYLDSMSERFIEVPQVGFGDQYGTKKYNKLETGTVENWKTFISTSFRKKYAMKYLQYLGKETTSTFGYDSDSLENDLKNHPTKNDRRFS